MNGILISGYYGFGNVGDEAILEAISLAFKEIAPQVPLRVLAKIPSYYSIPDNMIPVLRNNLFELLKAICNSKLVLAGGGGLIQDTTSLGSLLYYLGILFLAQLFKRKTMIFAQGIGPFKSHFSKTITRLVLNGVNCITVRDEDSSLLLQKIGVKKPVKITADPVFLLSVPQKDKVSQLLNKLQLNDNSPYVVVVVRDWAGINNLVSIIANAIIEWAGKISTPVRIVILPFQKKMDIIHSSELENKLREKLPVLLITENLTIYDLLAVISRSKLVVSMRLHALIFSAISNVPFLGLSYDPKVVAIARNFRQSVLPVDTVTSYQLQKQLEEVWSNLEENKASISNLMPICKSKAWETMQMALSLL